MAEPSSLTTGIREQLVERRARLSAIPDLSTRGGDYSTLLAEVDAALARLESGRYGTCEGCDDPVEPERLAGDPLVRVCLGCLSDAERRALERDLELAAVMQQALLPPQGIDAAGWEIAHRYLPLGPVSGDFCDVLRPATANAPLHVALGDVSGKGVSASILMSHLQAIFRSLASLELPLPELVGRANHILCEGNGASAFASLVLARLEPDGSLELCNAGHNPALVFRKEATVGVAATGLPLGIFRDASYTTERIRLERGEGLFLYTDGLTEAVNGDGVAYGEARIEALAGRLNGGAAGPGVQAILADLDGFQNGAARRDDLTLMLVQRSA